MKYVIFVFDRNDTRCRPWGACESLGINPLADHGTLWCTMVGYTLYQKRVCVRGVGSAEFRRTLLPQGMSGVRTILFIPVRSQSSSLDIKNGNPTQWRGHWRCYTSYSVRPTEKLTNVTIKYWDAAAASFNASRVRICANNIASIP